MRRLPRLQLVIIVRLLRCYVLLHGAKWQLPPLEKTEAACYILPHSSLEVWGLIKCLLDTTESVAGFKVLHRRPEGWKINNIPQIKSHEKKKKKKKKKVNV